MNHITTARKGPLILGLAIALLFASCDQMGTKKAGPLDLFAEKLKSDLKPIPATIKKPIGSVAENLRLAYTANNYHPIWVGENYATTDAAAKLLDELEDMRWDGLEPERYHVATLKKLKIILDTTKNNSLRNAIAFDTLMTHSYLAAARDLLLGAVLPRKADSLWYHANDSSWRAPQLLAAIHQKYPSLDSYRSKVPTYGLLRDEYRRYYSLTGDSTLLHAIAAVRGANPAGKENISQIIKTELPWITGTSNDTSIPEKQWIATYQEYNGLKQTGKTDSATLACLTTPPDTILAKISANMERIRWMQQDFGNLYLIVDVPLMELFLRKDGINEMHMPVIVGKPERQTPSLFATMANIVINPPWEIPPTILKKDVTAGFEKEGKKYLAKKGFKAYDSKGNLVRPSLLNMGNLRRYTYKQAPGDDNALGAVKFNLPNPWDIYLHDTPHRGDFAKSYRALSSGCVRVQQPQQMAVYILSELEKKRFTRGRLDSLIATHKTRWEPLKTKIPVHIAYLTAFEDTTGKHIRFTSDIYGRDGKLISLLGRK